MAENPRLSPASFDVPDEEKRIRSGFDATPKRRQDDHLDRWPFAREIYAIAADGPSDWSVRIGVYGEWGTGKTTVLEFVGSMAKQGGHTVIWFNPWEYSTADDLWRAFVLTVFNQSVFAKLRAARKAKAKAWMRRLWSGSQVVQAGVELFHDRTGKLIGSGLELVKHCFRFSAADLESLREALGNKRVIVLIDDLDRTAATLVPQILFALKEIMDTPGFSFVAAFDPCVVGKVLGHQHVGFDDGLKFLDKIIDYPRWLPPAPVDALTKLAIADSKRFCDYVPEEEIRDAVPLLPQNPRAIRQFVRSIALLKPQIERYYPRELHWPTILAANVLKIRHPRIAYALLRDETFWKQIDETPLLARDGEEQTDIDKQIAAHIESVAKGLDISLTEPSRNEIKGALTRICSQFNRWALRTSTYLSQQAQIAEIPHAVTWKEFDDFVKMWESARATQTAREWIANHARQFERSPQRVYAELFEAGIITYANSLRDADSAFIVSEPNAAAAKAESLLALIECLIFDLGNLDKPDKPLAEKQLNRLFETFATFVGSTSPVQARLSTRNEAILIQLIERWTGDVSPLMGVVKPYDPFGFTHYEGRTISVLHKELRETLLPRFARQIIAGFRDDGFVDKLIQATGWDYNTRYTLFNPTSVLWKELRAEAFGAFNNAGANRIVQENAYELLQWFLYKLQHESGSSDSNSIRGLLSDEAITKTMWDAATATELGLAPIARLRAFPEIVKRLGVAIDIPGWWAAAVEKFPKSREQATSLEEHLPKVVEDRQSSA